MATPGPRGAADVRAGAPGRGAGLRRAAGALGRGGGARRALHRTRAAPRPPPDGESPRTWRLAGGDAGGQREAYRRYLERYPDGPVPAFAGERIARAREAAPPPAGGARCLAGADRGELAAALTTLGFLSARAGRRPRRGTRRGLLGLRAAVRGAAREPRRLYLDAAQVTVMLGAATAQRIRTDMAALASIETALGMAGGRGASWRRWRMERRGARGAGRADATSRRSRRRARVQARLDQSRSYYAELVARGSRHFRPYLARALAGLPTARAAPRSSRGASRRGCRPVRGARDRRRGRPSRREHAWLADFLPR